MFGCVARWCYFLPEWRQRGCGLVNCVGRSDASWLCCWPSLFLCNSSRLAEKVDIDFFFFLSPEQFFIYIYFFLLPIERHLPADLEWLGARLAKTGLCFEWTLRNLVLNVLGTGCLDKTQYNALTESVWCVFVKPDFVYNSLKANVPSRVVYKIYQ